MIGKRNFFYIKKGKFKEAILSYQKSIAINPDHGETHNNLGAVFHKLGKFKYALHHYSKAIKSIVIIMKLTII